MSGLLSSYVFGLLAIVAMAVAWVAVQSAWGRAFPAATPDPDVLARRPGCGSCGCGGGDVCSKDRNTEPAAASVGVIHRGSARRRSHE